MSDARAVGGLVSLALAAGLALLGSLARRRPRPPARCPARLAGAPACRCWLPRRHPGPHLAWWLGRAWRFADAARG